MADLDEIVDLGAASDARFFEAGAVDGRIGADFDIVFDDDDAELFEFLVLAFGVCRIAKTAGADDGAWLEDDMVA